MKLFISGNPLSGKTSLIKKLIEDFGKDRFFGFYTEELRKDKKRVGFVIVTTWNDSKILASVDVKTPFRVGKYYILKENLDKISEYFLENLKQNMDKIVIIDEIGPMEFYSDKFKEIVKTVLEKDLNLIATVHRKFIHLVPTYVWLDRGKWWEVYKYIKKKIKEII